MLNTLLLPIIDLLFEDLKIMWRELCCKKDNNKNISLKIHVCTKLGVNLKIRWGNGNPEDIISLTSMSNSLVIELIGMEITVNFE